MNKDTDKSLPVGYVLSGRKHDYEIAEVIRADGQGFTYKVTARINNGKSCRQEMMVVREHMMVRCSSRADDGATVVTPAEIAPTVKACLDSFRSASRQRLHISESSPWIIRVVETFEANNTCYYVVEYLNGITFEEYVKQKGGSLTYEQTREVLSPIFDAVRTLHTHYCLHTDIIPRHIMLLPNSTHDKYTPVLFSLYATLHFNDKGIEDWTLPIMNCEEGYAPPEQYGSIEHFFPQTDVYSLAATMVYALSGLTLPDSRTVNEQAIRSTLPATLPESLVSALLSALNPDPMARTQSVSHFREDLRNFTQSSSTPYREDENEAESTGSHILSWIKSNAWWILTTAVAVTAILFII